MASGREDEADDPSDASHETSDEEDLEHFFEGLSLSNDRVGEWLPNHPWHRLKPDPNLKMKDTVTISASYRLLDERQWIKRQGRTKRVLDLSIVFSQLPIFLQREMQGSINGSRHELERLVKMNFRVRILSPQNLRNEWDISNLPPHTREILDKDQENDSQKDKPSFPPNRHLKAISISILDRHENCGVYLHIDCEYMLKMFVPDSRLSWFDIQQCSDTMEWIQYKMQKIKYPNKEKRWIFTPSFRRAKIALLAWPGDDILTEESTISILVVRPSEFKEYVQCYGHLLPVICLPQDEIGAGYPRYWIQKIALHLKLQYIWMIDDSVECFYEYHPDVEPPPRQDKDGKIRRNYRDFRRRKFGLVFKRIEDFVKEADDSDKPIAAMSPRRWNPKCKPQQPFVCKPPQGAVYLNIRALSEKNVRYRPELKFLEDMIFGYECEKKGLKVYMDNRVHMKDHNWKNTGARSPSVQSHSTLDF